MALIVEDGTARADADSYTSSAEADAYFAFRGNEAWDNVDNKDAALRKATDYMQQAFGQRWKGYRTTLTQALDWPRVWVEIVDAPYGYGPYANYLAKNVIPIEVKRACAELAYASTLQDLIPRLDRAQSSIQIGDITVEYDPSSPEMPRYPQIEMMLSRYLETTGAMAKLVRA